MSAPLTLARARIIRWLAAAIVLVLSSAGLSIAGGALPAQAGGGYSDSNDYAAMTVDRVTASPGPWDPIEYTVTISPLNGSDCVNNGGTIIWNEQSGRNAALIGYAIAGDSVVFTYRFASLSNGGILDATVQTSGGCASPDSETPALQASVQFTAPYYQRYVYGYAIQGSEGADDWSDPTTRIENAAVALIETNDEFGTPIFNAMTDANGGYTLYAPLNEDADIARTYKIRFTMPDGEVLYYDNTASPWSTSTSSWAAATIGGPADWGNTSYSAFIAFDSGPGDPPADPASETNLDRECFAPGSSSMSFDTDPVHWKNLCLTDPTLNQVATIPGDRSAITGFGSIYLDQPAAQRYYVTADQQSSFELEGVWHSSIVDRDIYLPSIDKTVYVTVDRTIDGIFMRWDVAVRDSETDAVVDVPFHFSGDLGSSDSTDWTGGGEGRVADDSLYDSAVGALTIHHVSAQGYAWSTVDGSGATTVDVNGGTLSYILGVLDYSDCLTADNMGTALELALSAVDSFGETVTPLAGDACAVPFTFDIPLNPMQVGVPFDQVLTVPAGPWDFTFGGSFVNVNVLPPGLSAEVLDAWTNDTAPRLHLFGIPTATGSGTMAITITDDVGNDVDGTMTGTVIAGAPADWPMPTVHELRVDAAFDQTFTPPLTGHGWNWAYGAEAEAADLPDGLSVEYLDQYTDDSAPSFRITGTPTTVGPYDFTLWVEDDYANAVQIHLTGSVLGPVESSDMTLEAQIGDIVAGSEVTFGAEGLKEGADYTLVVHSTAITLASGTVTVSHSILGTAVIPAGLEAGWHSLTLSSRWFSQSNFDGFQKTIWFLIDANGRLLQISALAPAAGALAYSGSTDPTGSFLLAAAALALGLWMVWSRARRRVRIR